MGKENQPFISNRVIKVAEGTTAATSLGTGIASVATGSAELGIAGLGLMVGTIALEIARQTNLRRRTLTASKRIRRG